MALRVTRRAGESWRDCAVRYADPYGLRSEVLIAFDDYVRLGNPEEEAAFAALYDWDLLDYVRDAEVQQQDSLSSQGATGQPVVLEPQEDSLSARGTKGASLTAVSVVVPTVAGKPDPTMEPWLRILCQPDIPDEEGNL